MNLFDKFGVVCKPCFAALNQPTQPLSIQGFIPSRIETFKLGWTIAITKMKSHKRRSEIFRERLASSGFTGYSAYRKYLKSDSWNDKKTEAVQEWGKKAALCFFCRAPQKEWHHQSYSRVGGNEAVLSDLRPMCSWCHRFIHALARSGNIRWWTVKVGNFAGKLKSTQKKRTFFSPEYIREKLLWKFSKLRCIQTRKIPTQFPELPSSAVRRLDAEMGVCV